MHQFANLFHKRSPILKAVTHCLYLSFCLSFFPIGKNSVVDGGTHRTVHLAVNWLGWILLSTMLYALLVVLKLFLYLLQYK